MKEIFFISLLVLCYIHLSNSQTYEWEEVGKLHSNFETPSGFLIDGSNNLLHSNFINGITFRSTDDGVTWKKYDTIITRQLFGFWYEMAGDSITKIFVKNPLFQPKEKMNWWVDMKSIFSENFGDICYTKSNKIFLASGTGVRSSSDGGSKWYLIDLKNNRNGFDDIKNYSKDNQIFFYYANQSSTSVLQDSYNNIIVATYFGVYVSLDDGKTWVMQNKGLNDSGLVVLRLNKKGEIYVLTQNGKIYKSITRSEPLIVKQFLLFQNYPNPFNASTILSFSIPNRTGVKLNIYNGIGQLIEEILNSELEPGIHKIVWSSYKIASGAYFYRIVAGSFVETKKMLLLR